MQHARVFLRIEAGGGGVQRHPPRQADRGSGRAEGSHQTPRGEACRKQWGAEGPSVKQGKRPTPPPKTKTKNKKTIKKPLATHLASCTHIALLSLTRQCGGRRSWSRTSRWRRTACWSTSRSAWACAERCRTTSLRPGTSSHCQPLAIRVGTLSGPGVPDAAHRRFQFSSIIKL